MLHKNNYKNFEKKLILIKNVLPKTINVNFGHFIIFGIFRNYIFITKCNTRFCFNMYLAYQNLVYQIDTAMLFLYFNFSSYF